MKFQGSKKQFSFRQAGQGMTEYIIIVALIAVAAIGVYSMFGKTIRGQVAGLAGEVAGTGATTGKATAASAAIQRGCRYQRGPRGCPGGGVPMG